MVFMKGSDIAVIFMYIIVLFTVLGNITVLVAILTQAKTRSVRSNKFLLSLAAADMSVGMFVMLPSVLKTQAGYWAWGPDLCKLWVTLDVFFCSASIYSLIGISLDRLYAVYWPIKYATTKSRFTSYLIIMAWIIALAISTPMYMTVPRFSKWLPQVDAHPKECAPPTESSSVGYVIYAGTAAFIIPASLLIAIYTSIGCKMHGRQTKKIKRAKKDLKTASRVEIMLEEHSRHVMDEQAKNNNGETAEATKDLMTVPDLAQEQCSVGQLSITYPTEIESRVSIRDTELFEGTSNDDQKGSLGNQRKGGTRMSRKTKHLSQAERKLKAEEKTQRRITFMMGIIIGTFALSWFPFAVMFLLAPFSADTTHSHGGEDPEPHSHHEHEILIELITWVGYINSSLNPVIYAIMNTEIRAGMARFLCPNYEPNEFV